MKKSTSKPTKAHQARFEKLKRLGCIACHKEDRHAVICEIHHLNLGGRAGQKRRGHSFTIPLCAWHHRGAAMPGYYYEALPIALGPSLAKQSKLFHLQYGTDDELLAEVNKLIGSGE
jgi:hypothetical protein